MKNLEIVQNGDYWLVQRKKHVVGTIKVRNNKWRLEFNLGGTSITTTTMGYVEIMKWFEERFDSFLTSYGLKIGED